MASHSSFPPLLLTLITFTQQPASLCVPFIGKKLRHWGRINNSLSLDCKHRYPFSALAWSSRLGSSFLRSTIYFTARVFVSSIHHLFLLDATWGTRTHSSPSTSNLTWYVLLPAAALGQLRFGHLGGRAGGWQLRGDGWGGGRGSDLVYVGNTNAYFFCPILIITRSHIHHVKYSLHVYIMQSIEK